jgi:ABC-2 type transport system permease protein
MPSLPEAANVPPSRPPGSQLARYLRIYAELWKNSVVREMGFKTNFLLWIVVEALWFVLQLSFIGVMYLHTDRIATWSRWEVIMLVGASHFIQQIFQAFFLTNCTQISEIVRDGKLDFMLLLPVNTRFLVSLRQVDLGGFVNAGSGLAVMAWAARHLGYTPTVASVLGFFAFCAVGILVHYSLMFALSTISFWTVRSQGIVWGYYNMFGLARMPDTAFHGFFKAFFSFAIPMLLVANVPVRVLLQKLENPFDLLWLAGLAALAFWFSELFWRRSLQNYTSASN